MLARNRSTYPWSRPRRSATRRQASGRRGDGVQRIGGGRGGREGQRPPCRARIEAEHRPAPCLAIQSRGSHDRPVTYGRYVLTPIYQRRKWQWSQTYRMHGEVNWPSPPARARREHHPGEAGGASALCRDRRVRRARADPRGTPPRSTSRRSLSARLPVSMQAPSPLAAERHAARSPICSAARPHSRRRRWRWR